MALLGFFILHKIHYWKHPRARPLASSEMNDRILITLPNVYSPFYLWKLPWFLLLYKMNYLTTLPVSWKGYFPQVKDNYLILCHLKQKSLFPRHPWSWGLSRDSVLCNEMRKVNWLWEGPFYSSAFPTSFSAIETSCSPSRGLGLGGAPRTVDTGSKAQGWASLETQRAVELPYLPPPDCVRETEINLTCLKTVCLSQPTNPNWYRAILWEILSFNKRVSPGP